MPKNLRPAKLKSESLFLPYERTQDLIDEMSQPINTAVNGVIDSNPGSVAAAHGTSRDTNNLITNPMNNSVSLNEIFNHLRIPDAIKDLPQFDGNSRLLYEFINNVEEILSLLTSIDGTSYSKIILRAVRNKIVGQANEILNMYGTPLEWEHIKRNLVLHYSDKRNETSLIRDLHDIRQNNDTVEQFYSKIIEMLSTMTNHVNIHERNQSVIASKQTLYSEMCLNTFLIGLKEPLGSTIRAMRPGTLTEAFNFCIKEQNTYYMRNVTQHKIMPKVVPRHPLVRPHNLPQQQKPFQYTPQSRSITQFSPFQRATPQVMTSQPVGFSAQSDFRRLPPQNKQIAHTPNFQQQHLRFNRPNTINSRQPRPVPMDTSSGYTYLKQPQTNNNNAFRNPNNPNFTFKELHNITSNLEDQLNPQTEQNYQPELDHYLPMEDYSQEIPQDPSEIINEIDDSNFQSPASENSMDS